MVARGYKRLETVTRRYRLLQRVTCSRKGLDGDTEV